MFYDLLTKQVAKFLFDCSLVKGFYSRKKKQHILYYMYYTDILKIVIGQRLFPLSYQESNYKKIIKKDNNKTTPSLF